MNIYIYGSKSFRNDVHDELDHSNIKFKMDDSSEIIDVNNLDDLKHLISHNKEDIFLIDDGKIIKKDALEGKFKSKFKFLIPKDGIEEEYLFEHGIGDISFDSMDELAKHITNKLKEDTPSDDFENRDEIHESISTIVNDAYEEDDSIKLNDELNSLLVSNDFGQMNTATQDEVQNPVKEEVEATPYAVPSKESQMQTDDMLDDVFNDVRHMQDISTNDLEQTHMLKELEELSISNDDFLNEDVKKKNHLRETSSHLNNTAGKKKPERTVKLEDIQGEFNMAGDFSSLDEINESDIIAALNGEEVAINETQVLTSTQNEPVSLNINNTDDISELLSKLLKNKTLEITVKIKD